MRLAKEGIREMLIATVVLGAAAVGLWLWIPLLAAIPLVIWIWAISFFRDPKREGRFAAGEMCAPADGTVSEVTALDHHEMIGGPAWRVGIFLSIFNVHINRAPCAGTVRTVTYKPGEFLDARHPESGARNEANTLLIEPDAPHAGPIVVRQVAGLIARRIICHARPNMRLARGQRFGMIKFGSRTELILPAGPDVDITVKPGDAVRAGLTVLVRRKRAGVPGDPEAQVHESDSRRAIAEAT
ncbi:MAG TPA: phosphatidylserine decarboxylase [Phycisphaerae bacterium]|nr:phosphatidylserine decarboxylase [Phycisphaerales bacterium]HRX86778.1 phosphatidylserine decarboxylase [Phycisphaerae bacterium]